MSRTAKGSGFKMRSSNSPLFKEMGSSPLQAGDTGIIAAATPEQTIEPIDFTIKSPEIKIGKTKKKKGGDDNDEEEEEEEENNGGDDDNGGEDKSE